MPELETPVAEGSEVVDVTKPGRVAVARMLASMDEKSAGILVSVGAAPMSSLLELNNDEKLLKSTLSVGAKGDGGGGEVPSRGPSGEAVMAAFVFCATISRR